jgi:hypothetical protein
VLFIRRRPRISAQRALAAAAGSAVRRQASAPVADDVGVMRIAAAALLAFHGLALAACGREDGRPVTTAQGAAKIAKARLVGSQKVTCAASHARWTCRARVGRRSWECWVEAREYPPNGTDFQKPHTMFCMRGSVVGARPNR